jgi:hypothetical protein
MKVYRDEEVKLHELCTLTRDTGELPAARFAAVNRESTGPQSQPVCARSLSEILAPNGVKGKIV